MVPARDSRLFVRFWGLLRVVDNNVVVLVDYADVSYFFAFLVDFKFINKEFDLFVRAGQVEYLFPVFCTLTGLQVVCRQV